jgi:hypothetical protein
MTQDDPSKRAGAPANERPSTKATHASADGLDHALAALPPHDAADDVAKRVRRQALAELAVRRSNEGGAMRTAIALWSRVGMPVALASVVGVYLTWAFETASALYR